MSSRGIKGWLLVPFLGASDKGEQNKRGNRSTARASGADGGLDAISKEERIADFANESEEDAVEDYNAPMYVRLISTISTMPGDPTSRFPCRHVSCTSAYTYRCGVQNALANCNPVIGG